MRTERSEKVGGAVITTAGRLPYKGVVHVVGPVVGEGQEEDKLVSGLRAAKQARTDT